MTTTKAASTTKQLTAAAARFTTKLFPKSMKPIVEDYRTKQATAYTYWDDTPEVRFSGIWIGRSMGRARLFAGLRQDDGEIIEAPDGHPATDLVNNFAGGRTGQSQLLEQMGPHLVVAGEAWVVVVPRTQAKFTDTQFEDWHVIAPTLVNKAAKRGFDGLEVEIEGEKIWVPPAGEMLPDDLAFGDQPLAIRVWQPHPLRHELPDSPVMSSFTILDELRLLNAAVAAIAKSRLGGRGVLGVPAGAKLPNGDDLLDRLMEVAEIAYKDPASAAAIIPILLELPKGEKLDRVTFESEFDRLAIDLRQEAIRRYATASDTPAEVLLGQGDMNHWGVWASQDEAIRVGVEPRLATVCDGLTREYMWPTLDDDEAVIWYDTSPLRVRTNRSETALQLYDRNEIDGNALRRETGFDDADAPLAIKSDHAIETALDLVTKAPSLAQDPGLAVLVQLLRDIFAGKTPVEINTTPTDQQAPAEDTQLPVDESPGPPQTSPTDVPSDQAPAAQSDAEVLASIADTTVLAAAIDQIVVRALERAGRKIAQAQGRSKYHAFKGLDPSEIHTRQMPLAEDLDKLKLLEGAWDRVPEISERYCVNNECLTNVLDGYTRDLLVTGTAHEYQEVASLINAATCLDLVEAEAQ